MIRSRHVLPFAVVLFAPLALLGAEAITSSVATLSPGHAKRLAELRAKKNEKAELLRNAAAALNQHAAANSLAPPARQSLQSAMTAPSVEQLVRALPSTEARMRADEAQEPGASAVLRTYAEAADAYNGAASALAADEATLDLKPLTLAPGFRVNTGSSTSSSFVPEVQFIGKVTINPDFEGQVLLDLKPDPAAGTADQVAQSIRVDAGTVSANLGLNYQHMWLQGDDPKGPFGIEGRVGIPLSYQRAAASASDGSQGTTAATDFGIFSPEVKVSVWLTYVLLGYRYSYYKTFGNQTSVSTILQNTGGHKAYMAVKVAGLSGDQQPFYVEGSYTAKGTSFSGGTFALGFSKSLKWPSE